MASSISLLITIMLLLLPPSLSSLSCRLDFTSVALLSC
jgi:hypothetical protein